MVRCRPTLFNKVSSSSRAARSAPVTVTFLKKDGSERVMNCTLQEEVAVKVEKKTDRVKQVNEDVLPVYDLDAKGWRSFRWDYVQSYEVKEF